MRCLEHFFRTKCLVSYKATCTGKSREDGSPLPVETIKSIVTELKQQVIPREALEARIKAIEDRLP
jgi:hypothetical protein